MPLLIQIKTNTTIRKFTLFITLLIGFNACKTKDVAPDYTTNYVGVFAETKFAPNTSYSKDQKTIYDFYFSRKDNNTLNLNYTAITTYTYNNTIYTDRVSFSLSNIKVDNSVMTINEAVKLSYSGTDYNTLFTGTGNLSNNSLLLTISEQETDSPKRTKNFILIKKQ